MSKVTNLTWFIDVWSLRCLISTRREDGNSAAHSLKKSLTKSSSIEDVRRKCPIESLNRPRSERNWDDKGKNS